MVAIRTRPGLFRRPATWIVLILVALVVGVGLGVGLGWRAAVSRTLLSARCDVFERVDLSIDDIVDLKKRWKAFLRESDSNPRFDLSPSEIAFLLSGESEIDIALVVEHDELVARIAVPMPRGCYNIRFRGQLRIDDGLAVVEPKQLVIGGTDISELGALGGALGGSRQVIGPDDLQDEDLAARLRNIQSLRIEGGQVRVSFVDPHAVWR